MREERLRATAGLRPNPALSSWRGRSGRRYIVGVHPLVEAAVIDVVDAVILAVRRDPDGLAHVVDVAAAGSQPSEAARRRWMDRAEAMGANEVHIHRLADGEDERREIVEDLRQEQPQAS